MIIQSKKSTLTNLIQFILFASVGIAVFAVLLPIFNAVHNQSVRTVQSRMSDLGRAMQQYCADNDGLYPPGSCSFNGTNFHSLTGMGWAGQLYPYVGSQTDFDDAMGGSTADPILGNVVAFAINENASRNEKLTTWNDLSKTILLYQVTGAHAMISEIDEGDCRTVGSCSPSGNGTYIMLMDGLFPREVEPATGPVGGRSTDCPGESWPTAEIDNGSLYLFADGHVKWLLPQNVSSGGDAANAGDKQNGVATGHAAGTSNINFVATFSTK